MKRTPRPDHQTIATGTIAASANAVMVAWRPLGSSLRRRYVLTNGQLGKNGRQRGGTLRPKSALRVGCHSRCDRSFSQRGLNDKTKPIIAVGPQ